MKKNMLNPYRIESEDYYFLREILAPRGVDVPDERKREYRRALAAHADPLEKSARQEWRARGETASISPQSSTLTLTTNRNNRGRRKSPTTIKGRKRKP